MTDVEIQEAKSVRVLRNDTIVDTPIYILYTVCVCAHHLTASIYIRIHIRIQVPYL